jgi:CHAT domain-containing protein/tetratricopeptide (TPR) repeat protein
MLDFPKMFLLLITRILTATVFLSCTSVVASDEVDLAFDGFKKITEHQRAEALATLKEPLSANDLLATTRRKVEKKLLAAKLLNDITLTQQMYREAIRFLPDSYLKNNLAGSLIGQEKFVEGNTLRAAAIDSEPNPAARLLVKANQARDFYNQFRGVEASAIADAVFKEISSLEKTQLTNIDRSILLRSLSINYSTLSLIQERSGKFTDSILNAQASEKAAWSARDLVGTNSGSFINQITFGSLASAIQRVLSSNRAAGNLFAANLALGRYLKLAQEVDLGSLVHARIYLRAADIRFQERDFKTAVQLYEKSDALFESTAMAVDHPSRTDILRSLSQVHIGAGKYDAALAAFGRLDKIAASSADEKTKSRVRHRLERGITLLFSRDFKRAETEFKSLAKTYVERHGADHFLTLRVQGLQGVALWRMGQEKTKAEAFSLLNASVRSMLDPNNAQFLENFGIRKELRDLIIDAYIEAAGQMSSAGGLEALGIADWRNGGIVQEALSDAAVRSAAASPALQALVWSEQDARNEIRGLRSYLAGEAGGAASPIPAIATQMRERIGLLEKQRTELQDKIKSSFPDYDRLVRPTPPSVADITSRLAADEALLVVQPTEQAAYIWALAKDRPGAFARVQVSEAQVTEWVKALRTSLDVAALPADRRPPFAHTAAQALYEQLAAPVQATLQGKQQLIIAAGGTLGQIPFAVLQTDRSASNSTPMAQVSWLVKQAAISHVPSVAAWLAMRSNAGSQASSGIKRRIAEQPLMAWGDPVFKLASGPVTPAASALSVRNVSLTRANTVIDLETEEQRSAIRYSNIPELPETRAELLAIAKELGANPATDLLFGAKATRQSVLAANASGLLAQKRVIAFATHGLIAGDLPTLTQPALALAASSSDGTSTLAPLLLLEDVLGLKLNADWVVLSACNTAAADGKAEEALSGLARGFFYAGGRSLLVTHWAVESESATQITTETFKHYTADPTASKAESLRQAMLKLLNTGQTSHPALWAPYALVGDGAR